MQQFSIKKTAVLTALFLLLMIALQMISGVVGERLRFREQARNSIARSWTGEQKIIGPIWVVPYVESVKTSQWDSQSKKEMVQVKQISRNYYFLPENLQIESTVDTEKRYRGMYAVPVYAARISMQGTFSNKQLLAQIQTNKNIVSFGRPYLAMIINDIRGIPEKPGLQWGGTGSRIRFGNQHKWRAGGHAGHAATH